MPLPNRACRLELGSIIKYFPSPKDDDDDDALLVWIEHKLTIFSVDNFITRSKSEMLTFITMMKYLKIL